MPPRSPSNFPVAELFVPEIKELLTENNDKEIKGLLKSISTVDLAEAWNRFSETEQAHLFPLLSAEGAVSLFQELDPVEQEVVTRFFTGLPPKTVKLLARVLKKSAPGTMVAPASYPAQTVGGWMHPQRVEITPNLTSTQALERIRTATRLRSGGPDGYYITDKNGRLIGWVSLRDLIAAPPRLKLSEYMHGVRLLKLYPEQDQEEAVHIFTKYQPSMAPVVDKDDKLQGYLRSEDILPLAQKEASEDIAKMAGTDVADFESESVFHVVRLRLPWLVATCAGGLLVSAVVKHFDFVLGKIVVLAAFMPVIAAMGGNAGSQSSMVLVRSLTLREYQFSDRWKLLLHEMSVGATLGLIYGSAMGLIAHLLYGADYGNYFAVVIGVGMFLSMTLATALGVFVPLTLVRFGVDPATATGPLITTTTDLISVSSYFLLAFWLLI